MHPTDPSRWRIRAGCVAALLGAAFAFACLSKQPGDEAISPRIDEGGPGGNPGTGNPDGGNPGDGNPDGGPGTQFGGPGPWPMTNTTYGQAQGIQETPIVGTSTDETQNLWVATHAALYLLKPGDARFRRYAAAEGLHLQTNPAVYCDSDFGDRRCPIYGAAADPGISEIVGGGSNEVFVGYYGDLRGTRDWTDPNRHSGMIDRVRLQPNGTLQVDRFDMVYGVGGPVYWYNGTVDRLFYDHFIHRRELYAGCNHGVTRFRPDQFRYARRDEWFAAVNLEWMADHVHPYVCYHHACRDASDHMMGDWRGLAMAPDGNIWVAGRWTAGQIYWSSNLSDWMNRLGE